MSLPEDSDDIITVYHHLTSKAQDLLSDLTSFQNFTKSKAKETSDIFVSTNKFQNDVQREADLLKKYGANLPKPRKENSKWPVSTAAQTGSSLHQIRSSNISHLDLIWQDAKQARGVVGIRRQVRYTYSQVPEHDDVSSRHNFHARQRSRQFQQQQQQQQYQQYQCFQQQQQGYQQAMYYQPNGYPNHYQAQCQQQTRNGLQHGYPVPLQNTNSNIHRRIEKEHVVIDVVCNHGMKWIKLFTKTQRWLALDLAKEGLIDLSGDSDDDQASGSDGSSERMYNDKDKAMLEDLKLVKMAREFLAASKTTRVKYRHPIVVFHMPKISRGEDKDIDVVLSYLSHIGVVVRDAIDLALRAAQRSQETYQNGPLIVHSDDHDDEDGFWGPRDELFETDLSKCFDRMLASPPIEAVTETLNLDCTILIALVSDISHRRRDEIVIPTHYNGRDAKKDIEIQMKSEETDSLLTKHIYPLLRGRKLVCTAKAAVHLKNIVQVMGSQTETKRSNILLQYPAMTWRNSKQVQQQLQEVSCHTVHDLLLPIEVIEEDSDCPEGDVDAEVMKMVSNHPRLSPLNQSVFFHGWRNNLSTITLNNVVSEWLTRTIDRDLDEIECRERCSDVTIDRRFRGPSIITCGRERSLLGNDK